MKYSTGGGVHDGKWVGATAASKGEQAGPTGARFARQHPFHLSPSWTGRNDPLLQLLGCDGLKGPSRPAWRPPPLCWEQHRAIAENDDEEIKSLEGTHFLSCHTARPAVYQEPEPHWPRSFTNDLKEFGGWTC